MKSGVQSSLAPDLRLRPQQRLASRPAPYGQGAFLLNFLNIRVYAVSFNEGACWECVLGRPMRDGATEMRIGSQHEKFGDDRPQTELTRLWTGLRELSDRLVKVIERSAPSTPILVAGDWGAGKTSLLAVTRQRLADNHYPTIWFDSWSYEGEGPLLPLLLRTLWQHAPHKLARKRKAKRRWKRLAKATLRGIAQKGPPMAILAGAISLPHLGYGWGHLLHLIEPIVHGLGHGHDGDYADAIEVVQREFFWLVDEIVSRKNGKPLVLFIDNLDRCSPEAALSLIESLRVLIGGGRQAAPEVRYVVALDRTTLVRAVMQKFNGMTSYEGNRYLEKIFPISFHLPRPEGAAILQFVQSFLDSGVKSDASGTSPNISRLDDILSLALAEPIFANPRLMKRCIERFRMVLEFEDKPEEGGGDSDKQDYEDLFLAKWIAAGERWPTLRWHFSRHGNHYWLQIARYLGDGQAPQLDKDIVQLLAEQDIQGWLRRELLGTKETRLEVYRRADLRLGRFGL